MILFNDSINLASIADAVPGIFPSPVVIITTLISLAVLTLLVTNFAYKPIRKSIDGRTKYIGDNIKDSEDKSKEASKIFEDSIVALKKAKKESYKIIENAAEEGNQKSLDIILKAQRKSDSMMETAYKDIERQVTEAKEQIRNEIVDVAFEASKQLLEKEINEDINKKLIDEFIDSL
jgi:F-type H+-transporting ATPase subunit b